MKVLLTWQAHEDEIERVRAALPVGTEVVAHDEIPSFSRFDASCEGLAEEARDADILMGFCLPPGILDIADRLKLICWMHAGVNRLDAAKLKEKGIRVCNSRGANGTAVAEHAMALMLGSAKRLPMKHRAVHEAEYFPLYEPATRSAMLSGRTLLLVGLGKIGTAIAKFARAFDMNVVAIRRHPERGGEHADRVHAPDELLDLLPEADYVVLATPITGETEHFFGESELAAMKPTAFLINIARGNLTQEVPLYRALTEARIAGYAADVWPDYGMVFPETCYFQCPTRTGYHKLPNVLGTGDQAANAEDVLERHIDQGIESMQQFMRGDPLSWEVDLDLGY
jgi:phosphoglycerate dehydrogenase-like enzyme